MELYQYYDAIKSGQTDASGLTKRSIAQHSVLRQPEVAGLCPWQVYHLMLDRGLCLNLSKEVLSCPKRSSTCF
jgi:hypothetical protein